MQDVSTMPGIVSSPSGVTASDVNSVTGPPVPDSYLIGASLPITLESFTVTARNRDVLIAWVVGEEQNLSSYDVERSTDGIHWSLIGRVNPDNSRSYNLADKNLQNNIYYYRLRSIDKDGSFNLGPVRQVRIDDPVSILIYPNPVREGHVYIRLQKLSTIRLFKSDGMLVWRKQLATGTHRIQVNHLARGTYQVVIDRLSYPLIIQ